VKTGSTCEKSDARVKGEGQCILGDASTVQRKKTSEETERACERKLSERNPMQKRGRKGIEKKG